MKTKDTYLDRIMNEDLDYHQRKLDEGRIAREKKTGIKEGPLVESSPTKGPQTLQERFPGLFPPKPKLGAGQ
jgi:hypothetical protein